MKWNQWQEWCLWRAIEEGDPHGERLNLSLRAEATVEARSGFHSAEIRPPILTPAIVSFLNRRTRRLREKTGGTMREWMLRLHLPRVPWWVKALGWAVAMSFGYGMARLGNERELNLLALPLVGLLLWNAAVMLVSLWMELRVTKPLSLGDVGWVASMSEWLSGRLSRSRGQQSAVDDGVLQSVESRFEELTHPMILARRHRAARAWLHVAAAMVAAGSIGALFASGWAREYRAVWESTLLSDAAAGQFFEFLFGPASSVSGVPIPMEEVSVMRRGQSQAGVPGDALPWLKLYAVTLLLGVIIPRFTLALLACWRMTLEAQRLAQSQGWAGFALRLLRAVEGGTQPVTLISYGATVPEASQQRWKSWLTAELGGMTQIQVDFVSPASEEVWLGRWQPTGPLVVLVFMLASTPEKEVHRVWSLAVLERLHAAQAEAELRILLDASGSSGRWTAERKSSRENLWAEVLAPVPARIWVADDKGLIELRHRLS